MTTGQTRQQEGQGKPADPGTTQSNEGETFETDISETGDDGTTVRQAEVRKDDLSETKPPPQEDKS
ncbi:hypothetical protein PPMP20_29845 [Paraburkholderia phymatum]|uniref:Uncharacterized protein n=1 Tax=Paraburkholderia phymatum (strain DSM 17167 / CIP 108236 / LMG 21445 / STM815) TaxID=391038 RepID=B2JRY0_PARP8|nr:hypothetical protein [Paraburkholderia phymatum]ACC73899.1 hypothetical protein Bphy_4790 [Paraburkholderia phymatum STM815]